MIEFKLPVAGVFAAGLALACAPGLTAGPAGAQPAGVATPAAPVAPQAPTGAEVAAAAAPLGEAFASAAFRQAVAEAAYGAETVAAFYREREYAPLFTGDDAGDRARRAALLRALEAAPRHGLPAQRYRADDLRALFAGATSLRARGRAEVEAAKMFLAYARDISSGVLEPARLGLEIPRELPRRDPAALLAGLAGDDPRGFVEGLHPQSHEYNRLLAEKMQLERVRAAGGWGPDVPAGRLERGMSGPAIVALRDRLIAKGYLQRTASASYDAALETAVKRFQIDHGLEADGVAGEGTIAEVNASVDKRLSQILVALERERWLNLPEGKGARHVLVNLTDYTAKIVDDGVVTFETRAVVGATTSGKPTPEFSDVMEYMELNPTWTVPRGILARDYLPRLKRNPGAAGYLKLVDSRGRVVPRGAVNFSAYSARTFPFNLVQPPGPRNALGTVKFMFPNPHAIYLHDTPDKHLFDRHRRAYSSGCIRLKEPHEFAYHLLARQTATPKEDFHAILNTGQIRRIQLKEPVPVHLTYRTAFTQAKGRVNYREDLYGRDARLWDALQAAGVTLDAARG
ncbi:MAG: L,D-transpeptidase family protein [Paracoccaceae bacterium]|jgi:murein L,D-transpeptidase YcbB/YkuD|nr:L,D-transpeptidase family protein [Paracoccaceae bacterium]